MGQFHGITGNIHETGQIRCHINGRVRNHQLLVAARHSHVKDMADPSFGPQASAAGQDRAHQMIRVDLPLHQSPDMPVSRHRSPFDGFCCLILLVDNLDSGNIPADSCRTVSDPVSPANQHRLDQTGICRRPGTLHR